MKEAFAVKQTWIDRCFGNPAAIAALVVFMTSSATLVGAWYFENVLKILPCPLCLEQRIPYRLVIPLSLLIVITALLRAPWKLLAAGFIVIIVADLWGAVIGAYHAGLEWHLWAGPTDCSGSLSDLSANGSLLEQLHSVSVVRCDQASWRFLGISLAGYNVLISLALVAIAAFGLMQASKHGD